jgi:hypothetical protein
MKFAVFHALNYNWLHENRPAQNHVSVISEHSSIGDADDVACTALPGLERAAGRTPQAL